MSLEVVILAAGKGQRMHSNLPKVLQDLGGKPLLAHVVKTAKQLKPEKIHIIYGHGGDKVKAHFASDHELSWVLQDIQLGTGHAVSQALPFCNPEHQILVLYGDVPLVSEKTLKQLIAKSSENSLTLLTTNVSNPFGFGRIVRNEQGQVQTIVEEKDATLAQKAIKEIFTGILIAPCQLLFKWLSQINNNNVQGEYLLPEVTACAIAQKVTVQTLSEATDLETQGVNDKQQLAALERAYQFEKACQLMAMGATVRDPYRIDIRGDVNISKDVMIDVNVIFEGDVRLGNNVKIGANCVIKNCNIADDVIIKENSVLEQSHISDGCVIGPFARLRSGTFLDTNAQIGNFVEIKNSEIGSNSKASHLTYLGDAMIGKNVNIGAGTITCNYDGVNKHQTHIGNNVFVGSGTQLVAPVKLANGTTIGAGSTITDSTPENKLTLARTRQVTIDDWQRPKKKE